MGVLWVFPCLSFFRTFACLKWKKTVLPDKSSFCKRYVDNTNVHRKENTNDVSFQNLNDYYKNIKLTLEENPKKFLVTKVIRMNNTILTQVFIKSKTFPFHWSSRITTNYKSNTITNELRKVRKITTNINKELRRIKAKSLHASYSVKFINGIIVKFSKKKDVKYQNGFLMEGN